MCALTKLATGGDPFGLALTPYPLTLCGYGGIDGAVRCDGDGDSTIGGNRLSICDP